jgi:hypothetical protein
MPDPFTKPYPLEPHVVIDITEHVEAIVSMLACHESQVFEWLPFNRGIEDQLPSDAAGRRAWLREWSLERPRRYAQQFRDRLIQTYGGPRGKQIEYCEAYEISEYAAPLTEEARRRLFPFLP